MTALPTGPMTPGYDWGQFLASVGSGLSAAGAPGGGWAAFAPAVTQARQNYQANAMDRRRFQILEEQAKRTQEQWDAEQRTANQQAAERARINQAYLDIIAGNGPMSGSVATASAPQVGRGPMQGGTAPAGLMNAPDARAASGSLSNIPSGLGAGSDGIEGTADDEQPTPGPMQGGGFDLSPQQRQLLATLPPEEGMKILAQMAFKEQNKVSPQSALAKLKADLDAGLIDRPTYDAMVRKETAAPQGPGLTERQRNAAAVGLNPGTPEYQQYILGRDDNEGGGPFEGTGLDNQAMNILLTGNSASSEYAAAYAHLAQPKVQFDPTTNRLVTISPDLSWAAKPQQQGQGAPLPIMPGVGGDRPGPTVQSAQALPQSSMAPAPGTETMQVPGATITSSPGTGLSANDRSTLRKVRAEAQSIRDTLTRFKSVVKETGVAARVSAATGGLTEGGRKLNSAWTNAAIMTKAEALFNLGVLNGPDLQVIQGTLPNPSTVSGAMSSDDAYATAIDEVLRLIDSKVAAYEGQFSGGVTSSPSDGGAAPSGGTRVDQLPAGNWQ